MAGNQEVPIPTKEFLEQLQQQLPQSEKDGGIGSSVKKFLASLPNLVYGGHQTVNYKNTRESIESLQKMISSTQDTKECLVKALDYHEKCGIFEKVWDKLSGCASRTEMMEQLKCSETNLEKLRVDYLEGIKKVEEKCANSLLTSCSISSIIICIVEIVKLINIWECIDDANNCIMGGEDKQKVVSNMASLRIKLDEVSSYQAKFGEDGKSISERRDIMDEIDNRMPEIQQLIFETRRLIGKVQIAINGKQEQLAAHQKDLKAGMSGTGAQLALNLFQFGFATSPAGKLMNTICSVALCAHSIVVGAQFYTKMVTQNMIDKCRVAYAELDQLDQQVQAIQVQYNEIRLWVKKIQHRLKEEEAAKQKKIQHRLKEEEAAKQKKILLFVIIGVALSAIFLNYISFRIGC